MHTTFSDIKKGLLVCVKIATITTLVFSILLGQNYAIKSIAITFFISLLYSVALGFGHGYINAVLNKKWDWLQQTQTRIYAGIIATVFYTIPVVLLLDYITFVVINNMEVSRFFENRMLWIHLNIILIALGISAFIHAKYFMEYWKKSTKNEVVQHKIIAGTAAAKFESLKNQIDPHFLFNSLNVLRALIEENPENAQKFTTSLSKIYRYILEQKDKELVPVSEELEFAKTYMNLLKMRFEDSISYAIPSEVVEEEAKVVPLSLQLLLENTIKHNIVSENKPLHININIQKNQLIVENNKQKKEVLQDRRGVGLSNIINRYALLTKDTVKIEEDNNTFRVILPILTQKNKSMQPNNLPISEKMAYEKAVKQVKAIKGFYSNLISYCIVIPILIGINYKTYWGFQWFWFPMLGWGLGLTFHGLETFGYGKNWEEKKIQEILDKEKNK